MLAHLRHGDTLGPCEDCDDYDPCTVDDVDHDTGECVYTTIICDDGHFCNGVEICENGICVSDGDPCSADEHCDEDRDICVTDWCTSDAYCDDGLFCNGDEACDGTTGDCMGGTDPCLEDETCDENTDECVIVDCRDDSDCDDGLFCNGQETCDTWTWECVPGQIPCWESETCDEAAAECIDSEPCTVSFEEDFSADLAAWTVVSEGDNTYNAQIVATDGNPPPSLLLDDLGSYHVFANSDQTFSHVGRCLEISVDFKHGSAASSLQRHASFRLTGPDGYQDHDFFIAQMVIHAGTNPAAPNTVRCELRYDDGGVDAWESSGNLVINSGDGWHTGRIAIEPDGIVLFYLDGAEVYTSAHQVISRFDGHEVVQIGSRKSSYDNVVVKDCCAVDPCAVVVPWGRDHYGQLSGGPSPGDLVAVASGDSHSLALRSDGSIEAWGRDLNAQVRDTPTEADFVAIAAGHEHSVAIRSDGSLAAWGRGMYGALDVPAGSDFIKVAAGRGGSFNLALTEGGSIVAWGHNASGQVDDAPTGYDFVEVSAGGHHALALAFDGSIVGWGSNDHGEADAPPGAGYRALAAGYHHSLAIRSDGSLIGWGDNGYGQCDVPSGHDYIAVSAGWYHSVALRSDGSIIAWGDDTYGQLGVPPGTGHVMVSAGAFHSLALARECP